MKHQTSHFFFGLILLTCIASPSFSATTWTKIGPTGGPVVCLKSFPDKPEIVLCGLQKGGAFRSTNRAFSWTSLRDEPVYDIATLDSGKAFLAGKTGLFYSEDYGISWEKRLDFTCWQVVANEKRIVIVDTVTARRLNAYTHETESALLLSRDSGHTWEIWASTEDKTPNFIRTELSPAEKRGSILFHSGGTVFRSLWTKIFKADSADLDTWERVNPPNYTALLFLQDTSQTIFAYSRYYDFHPGGCLYGRVYSSPDTGKTWNSVRIEHSGSVTALAKFESLLFAGDEQGQLHQYDLLTKQSKMLGEFGGEITAIDARTWQNRELIVSTLGGIYKTRCYGDYWAKTDRGIEFTTVNAIQIIPPGPGQAGTGLEKERIIMAVKNDGLWYNRDNSDRWEHAHSSMQVLPGMIQSAPKYPNVIYAGSNELFISENAGEKWKTFEYIPEMHYYGWYGRFVDIDLFPDSPYHILLHFYDHSLDDYCGIKCIEGIGPPEDITNWQWQTHKWFGDDYNLSCKAQIDTLHNYIWVTRYDYDSNQTKPALLAINSQTFEPVKEIFLPDSSIIDFFKVFGDTIYAVSHQERLFAKSTDLGNNWTLTPLDLKKYHNYADWAAYQPFGQLVRSPDNKQLFFIYPGNGILMSKDSGQTWSQIGDELPTEVIYQIEFSPVNPQIIYAATDAGCFQAEFITELATQPERKQLPVQFQLLQNYPNPFNAITRIEYFLPRAAKIELSVFNLAGQRVVHLINQKHSPGWHSIQWNGLDSYQKPAPSGIYWLRLKGENGESVNKKMILMK